jgi:hypothetical protein
MRGCGWTRRAIVDADSGHRHCALPKEKTMFGFRGGESEEIVARKRAYMRDAQRRWPFITHFDASTIKNGMQLAALVGDRSGRPRAEAEADVGAWTAGKQFEDRT